MSLGLLFRSLSCRRLTLASGAFALERVPQRLVLSRQLRLRRLRHPATSGFPKDRTPARVKGQVAKGKVGCGTVADAAAVLGLPPASQPRLPPEQLPDITSQRPTQTPAGAAILRWGGRLQRERLPRGATSLLPP